MDGMLAGHRHIETEHIFSRLSLEGLSIHTEGHFRLVGVNLDFRDSLGAIYISFASDMNKGLPLVPVRLVKIESVLFRLAVKGHQSLLVLTMLAALIPSICCKVEDIPDVRGP